MTKKTLKFFYYMYFFLYFPYIMQVCFYYKTIILHMYFSPLMVKYFKCYLIADSFVTFKIIAIIAFVIAMCC